MITTILLVFIFLYIAELIFLRIGLAKAERVSVVKQYEPTVSVIVAARNEAEFIGDCLASLILLDYPQEKLELIVVNDGSTDRTAEIIESFREKYPTIKMVTTKPGIGNLRGKTNAVSQGIDVSNGEILMFTDADCRVQPSWVQETVKYFEVNTGIVGGFTQLDSQRTFEGIQTLDWLFLFGLASATVGWQMPLTVIGNNLSVRRKAYDETRGYKEIPFSVTEDYALVQAVLRKTKFQVRFPIDSRTLVRSRACQTWNQLYRQKQRWGVGGLDMVIRGFVIMVVGWVAKLALIILLFNGQLIVGIAAFVSTAIVELGFIWKPLKRFNARKCLKYFPAFSAYLLTYVLIIPFVAFFSKKVTWKERRL